MIPFEVKEATAILKRTPAVLHSLLYGLQKPWIHSNEGSESWSPYEVMGHLIHGEKTDWLPRTRIILKQAGETFTPFDRKAQQYNDPRIPLKELLEEFKALRKANLAELSALSLTECELDMYGIHPEFGHVTLRQLLATWVAHDLDHLCQISRVLARNYKSEAGPWINYLPILQDS